MIRLYKMKPQYFQVISMNLNNFVLDEEQKKDSQIERILKVSSNAQSYRNRLNTNNNFGFQPTFSGFQKPGMMVTSKKNESMGSLKISNRLRQLREPPQTEVQAKKGSRFPFGFCKKPSTKLAQNVEIQPQEVTAENTANESAVMSFYDYHMMSHIFSTITQDHCKFIQRQPYLNHAFNSLAMASQSLRQMRHNPMINPKIQSLVNQQLKFAMKFFDQSNPGFPDPNYYYEAQSWMIVLVTIYKSLADNYDPFRRRILKLIFTALANPDLPNTIECLRWMENNRLEVLSLNKTQTHEDVMSKAGAILFDVHENRNNFLRVDRSQTADCLPNLTFVHLSSKELPRKKTVNILVSGFLSEDMCKKSQWEELLQIMPDSQIYALQWESDKIANLVKFMGSSCVDLLTAKKMKDALQKKFKDNPFIPAMKSAQISGRYLAEIVVRLFPEQFINISGYSLGSQLIKQFLERMIEMGQQYRLSNVYMMGGVSNQIDLAEVIKKSKYPLCIYNCFTDNDMVLKHILSLCNEGQPIGLHKIRDIFGHEIVNVDSSDFISGHLAYMNEFDIVGKVLQMFEE